MTFQQRAASQVSPPGTGGTVTTGLATSSTAVAANLDLTITFGGAYITFEARGGNVFMRFKPTATTAATTAGNASNGMQLLDGHRYSFWITKNERFCDHIASASCSLYTWQTGPNFYKQP